MTTGVGASGGGTGRVTARGVGGGIRKGWGGYPGRPNRTLQAMFAERLNTKEDQVGKPSVNTSPVAAKYAGAGERMIEYSDASTGTGGLIALRVVDGKLHVDLYRHDADVVIRVGKPDNAPPDPPATHEVHLFVVAKVALPADALDDVNLHGTDREQEECDQAADLAVEKLEAAGFTVTGTEESLKLQPGDGNG